MDKLFQMSEKHTEAARAIPYPPKPVEREYYSEWVSKMTDYRTAHETITESFKIELFTILKIIDHPKRERLFAIAWEHGHGHGYYQVAMEAEELAELLD